MLKTTQPEFFLNFRKPSQFSECEKQLKELGRAVLETCPKNRKPMVLTKMRTAQQWFKQLQNTCLIHAI
jgi:hypothetical protein